MLHGLQGIAGDEQPITLTLYTDAFVVRGLMRTRQRRITDILNRTDQDFLVLHDVTMDEYGSRTPAARAEYAQVNLASVLFAVAEEHVDPAPELRTPKVPEQAMVVIPPFRIVGRIHLLPERNLGDALEELTGRFVPATDAMYWSDTVGEARQSAALVAFNHARAQILAPHREVDPWEGLNRGQATDASAGGDRTPDAIGEVPDDAVSTSIPTGSQDPWRDVRSGAPAAAPGTADDDTANPPPGNPWGGPGGDPWGTRRPQRDDELIG